MDALIGTTIDDKYEVRRLIGRGGMGSVYEAFHKQLQTHVAIKVLSAQSGLTHEVLTRFVNEAKSGSAFCHPNLVSTQAFGQIPGVGPYMVMELVRGRSLSSELAENGALSGERYHRIFSQCCDALAVVHEHGYVHRDIKPSNIMLAKTADGAETVKITDFGIAKLFGDQSMQALTRTGEILGTPVYMSPEQCTGRPIDQRADVYSLGCVMYEALSGAPPFSGETPMEVMLKHVDATADAPLKESAYSNVILHALEKDPDRRPQNMRALHAELDDAAKGIATFEVRKVRKIKGIPIVWLAVSAAVIIGIATSAFVVSQTKPPSRHEASHLHEYLKTDFDSAKIPTYSAAITQAREDYQHDPDSITAIDSLRDAVRLQQAICMYYNALGSAASMPVLTASYQRLVQLYEQFPKEIRPSGYADALLKLATFQVDGSIERWQYLQKAATAGPFEDPINATNCKVLIADYVYQKNQLPDASAYYGQALETALSTNVSEQAKSAMQDLEMAALQGQFRCAIMLGNLVLANNDRRALDMAVANTHVKGSKKIRYETLAETAVLYAERGDVKHARELLSVLPESEIKLVSNDRINLMRAISQYAEALCDKATGDTKAARVHMEQARDFARKVSADDTRNRFWKNKIG
jgi:serine/threonine protein kinase